jgi:hypothetical protein
VEDNISIFQGLVSDWAQSDNNQCLERTYKDERDQRSSGFI